MVVVILQLYLRPSLLSWLPEAPGLGLSSEVSSNSALWSPLPPSNHLVIESVVVPAMRLSIYHTELQCHDVGCVLGVGADRLLDRSLLSAHQQPTGGSALRHPCLLQNRTVPGSSSNTRSNGFCSCNCTRSQNQGMDISELEFVQIIIILLVMTLMIVVIICLLSHYWLPAVAFLSRISHTQRDQATQLVVHGHLNSNLPPLMQQQQLCHFQPTYPYLQQEIINLPPLICLSDGEELLPYKGPCSLQLRHPEQQLELSQAAVRAPPNRTVFDSDLIDIYTHMGNYPSSTACYSQYSNNVPPTDNMSGHETSQAVFHAGSSGPDSTTKASTDLNS
ncbi:protein TMEPAI-like [Xiphias gladius]|uniref:protein TMEPAI-like n=1 Tax=Xiphias gladius TaxID=8245 RepID=UPI001A97D698|nr:protein TMEPAI-like [Xiphias gladius]